MFVDGYIPNFTVCRYVKELKERIEKALTEKDSDIPSVTLFLDYFIYCLIILFVVRFSGPFMVAVEEAVVVAAVCLVAVEEAAVVEAVCLVAVEEAAVVAAVCLVAVEEAAVVEAVCLVAVEEAAVVAAVCLVAEEEAAVVAASCKRPL